METNKLPRLNSYVYLITYVNCEPFCISKNMVYMKSKDAFITEDMLSDSVIEEYRYARGIDDYGYDWTYTLKEAKEVVKKYAEEHNLICRFVKAMGEDAWNVELD